MREWWVPFMLASACLSVVGSTLIARHVIFGRKLHQLYSRILLCISILDFIYSINLAVFSIYFYPEGERIPDFTCTYEAFAAFAFSLPSVLYNGALSIYFLMTICFDRSARYLLKMEPFMHIVCLVFPLGIAVSGPIFEIYNPLPPPRKTCWVNTYPLDCSSSSKEEVCERGTPIAQTVFRLLEFIPFLIVWILLIFNNSWIFLHVFKTTRALRRYDVTAGATTSRRSSSVEELWTSNSGAASSTLRPGTRRSSITRSASRSSGSIQYVRQTAQQSALYVVGFFLVYGWFSIDVLLAGESDTILHVHLIMFPLAGLWNALVYFRPRYVRWRCANRTSMSRLKAVQYAVLSLQNPAFLANLGRADASAEEAAAPSTTRVQQQQEQEQEVTESHDSNDPIIDENPSSTTTADQEIETTAMAQIHLDENPSSTTTADQEIETTAERV